MSRFLATVGMMAFLASPALGQFTIDSSASFTTIGLGASGVGGATFAVDTSPMVGTFEISNPGAGSDYNGATLMTSVSATNTGSYTWLFPVFGVDLTTLPGEWDIMGFQAPPANPLSVFSNPTTGFNPGGGGILGGGPPVAIGGLLTEVLIRLASNGSAVGSPVTLDSTSWIPPLDGASLPAPFIVAMGADGTLGSAGGGPDEATIDNHYWIDFGDIQVEFVVHLLGDGSITPEPATMTLLGLGGLALIRRVRRGRS